MGIGAIMLFIGVVVLFLSRNLWFNYRVVGQVLDILGHPGVQERLFKSRKYEDQLGKTAAQYILITRHAPMLIIGTLIVVGIMYLGISAGGMSTIGMGIGALHIAAVLTWLINFDPAPEWLYRWHLTVLLTKANIDLEVIQESKDALVEKINAATNLTEFEVEFLNGQLEIVEVVLVTTKDTIEMLEQQQRDIDY